MNIDFGVVSKYISERGFGFVRGLLLGNSTEIFFHIKTIKKADPKLATILASDSSGDDLHFWFETEITQKGAQVHTVLSREQISRGAISESTRIIERVESYWRNIASQEPSWLEDVTLDLLGSNRTDELRLERRHLETEQKTKREVERKNYEAKVAQANLEEDEFQSLLAEMTKFGFTHSSQVSNYIVSNRLGYKYKNISGVVQMELNGTTWNFKGGFPPEIYARLCYELGLSNKGTRARAVAFESFGDIEERRRGR